jgi:hypothetical protein
MGKYERAAQFWAVLVLAAHHRQIVTYVMMYKATGVASYGQKDILSLIVAYCDSHNLPKLTTILVSEINGLPQDGKDDPGTVCTKQAQVFNFDWLDQKAPLPEDFKSVSS